MAKAPIPVVSLYDFIWWIGYSCKFQSDILQTLFNRQEVNQVILDSIEHFFLSDDWEQWSLHNHAIKMTDKDVWASHKAPLKQFIFDFDGDREYFAGKMKVQSASNHWGYQIGMDENWNILHFGRLSASRVRMQQT